MNDKLASIAEQLRALADEIESSEETTEEEVVSDSPTIKPSSDPSKKGKISGAIAAMGKYLK